MQADVRAVRIHKAWSIGLYLLTAVIVLTASVPSHAQVLIGSSGAGWQTWNLAEDSNNNYRFIDLNSNGAPFWDVPLLTFGGYSSTKYPANKSIGWCLTSTGDCQGVGSALSAPGPIPFWAMPYDSAADTGGAIDPTVFFRRNAPSYTATLFLNTATNNYEINEFGWFETNAFGTLNGTKHVLFNGSGYPAGSATPDPVGKTVTFTPTTYFGFYYADESDPETNNGPEHGCYAYTIFGFNDEDCTAQGTAPVGTAGNGQGDHVFAIFRQGATYWIAGQDPTLCSEDSDCNLTVVRLRRNSH